MDFAAGFYLSQAPSPPVCLGWSNYFVGSESGQTQRVKLLVSNRTQHPPPTPFSHTLSANMYLYEGWYAKGCPLRPKLRERVLVRSLGSAHNWTVIRTRPTGQDIGKGAFKICIQCPPLPMAWVMGFSPIKIIKSKRHVNKQVQYIGFACCHFRAQKSLDF